MEKKFTASKTFAQGLFCTTVSCSKNRLSGKNKLKMRYIK